MVAKKVESISVQVFQKGTETNFIWGIFRHVPYIHPWNGFITAAKMEKLQRLIRRLLMEESLKVKWDFVTHHKVLEF